MRRLVSLICEIIRDCGDLCGISTTHDVKTVMRRIEHEGDSFTTITLPTFAKDFERSLDTGRVDDEAFLSFKKGPSGLPHFLGGFLRLVFDSDGVILPHPSIDSIRSIRQITMSAGKIVADCTPEREAAAFRSYVETDDSLLGVTPSAQLLAELKVASSRIFGNTFSRVTSRILDWDILPKHGPGTTADHTLGNQKYAHRRWTSRLESMFPHGSFFMNARGHDHSLGCEFEIVHPGAEEPVRVISVPKTMKTPRLIAVEPVHMQYMQQALLETFVEEVAADKLLHSFIGNESQEPNRVLARKGSSDGSLATLDLSEASDRVSIPHVANLLGNFTTLMRAVMVTRSATADVPGFGLRPIRKFASMGSALCFPMESFVFFTIVLIAIAKQRDTSVSRRLMTELRGRVRVYGDDIIVPTEYAESVASHLELFGLKVNQGKSFWTGKFRESCGGDYYLGQDVGVIRIRRDPGSALHSSDATTLVSMVALRNQLFLKGWYHRTVDLLDNWISREIPFPVGYENTGALVRLSHDLPKVERMDPHLQRPLVRAAVVDAPLPVNSIDGYDALMKFFLKRGLLPSEEGHLHRSGRPSSVRLKTKWVALYQG